jgi:hypothetical protein
MSPNHSTLEGRGIKVFTVTVAVGLSLCFAATALASDKVPPPRGPQGLPGPGPSVAPTDVAPSDSVPPPRGPQGLPGPGPTSPPPAESPDVVLPPPDEGLSAFTILLIALGGTVALTGVAYIVTRTTQHRRAVS